MPNLQIRLLLTALRTWSRFAGPMRPGPGGLDPGWNPRSARHAPLVGMLIAMYAWLAYVLAAGWFSHSIALLAAIAIGLITTGAVHERGLAALFDGFAVPSGARLGAPGASALLIVLITRFEVLSAIDPSWIGLTLLCGAAFSKGCAVLVMQTLSGASPPDTTAGTPPRMRGVDLGIAVAWSLLPLVGAIAWTGADSVFVTAGALALSATALVRRHVRRVFGQHTGSCFGGVQQLAELAFQLGILATLGIADETLADPTS